MVEGGERSKHSWWIHFFSAEKCRLKVKGLKSKYERQKKKNNTSGESPAFDEDEEDFDVFEKIPDMKPKAVLDSGTGTSKKRPQDDSLSEETEPLPGKFPYILYHLLYQNISCSSPILSVKY